VLLIEFLTDANSAAEFVRGVLPANFNQKYSGSNGANPSDLSQEERSRLVREQSRAQMQGYKRPSEREPETVLDSPPVQVERPAEQTGITQNAFTEAPVPALSDAERAELEELRQLKASREQAQDGGQGNYIDRPAHEA
jgi:hypothetical protein